MKKWVLLFMATGMVLQTAAQDKLFTMEEAITGYHLRSRNQHIVWQGSTNRLTYIEEQNLVAESAATGEKSVLFTMQQLNRLLDAKLRGFPQFTWLDEHVLELRHQGSFYRIDVTADRIVGKATFPPKAENITWSAAAESYAYTIANNLYILDKSGHSHPVTADKEGYIINGQTVSRNEFGISGGIFWSPDGRKLAFYRKDESRVATFPLLDITTRTGTLKEIRYPMAGMPSEQITLGVFDLVAGQTTFMQVEEFDAERYLTNITWAPASDRIYIQVLNRGQNHMRLCCYDAQSGKKTATLFEERSESYVEPQHPLVFTDQAGKRFIYSTNNRDGYHSLYLYDISGKLIRRLTPVAADVKLVGLDPAGKTLYYLSAEVSPVEEHLFKTALSGGKATRLTQARGWHSVTMSHDKTWFIDNYSSVDVPRVINLATNKGKVQRTLLEAADPFENYATGELSLGSFTAGDGTELYYRLIKPVGFDPAKKYPVIHYVYGGPHSQMVTDTWKASLRNWEMYMAQRGYVVFVMDNRGTGHRGKAFEDAIFRRCGEAEMADQVEGIRFLMSHPWVDADRIGVHGWSYGGFMTITLLINHPEIYKAGVAGGPVIDWKWYEAMYGERYMDTPGENPEGYEKSSLLGQAKNLKRKLLICQGAVDPVVVWQHSLNFIQECIRHQVPVDYFPYPVAEHNVMGRDRIHLMQKVTDYFEDYLK